MYRMLYLSASKTAVTHVDREGVTLCGRDASDWAGCASKDGFVIAESITCKRCASAWSAVPEASAIRDAVIGKLVDNYNSPDTEDNYTLRLGAASLLAQMNIELAPCTLCGTACAKDSEFGAAYCNDCKRAQRVSDLYWTMFFSGDSERAANAKATLIEMGEYEAETEPEPVALTVTTLENRTKTVTLSINSKPETVIHDGNETAVYVVAENGHKASFPTFSAAFDYYDHKLSGYKSKGYRTVSVV